ARVSGLNRRLADNLGAFRNTAGAFRDRLELRNVPGLGEKAFEQAAGFLRLVGGANPLDASAVHPESYPVVERICEMTGTQVSELVGQVDLLRRLSPETLADDRFGGPTIRDILAELEKPGRDPRPEFRMAAFADGVEEIEHVQPGMVLEGVVTNVANFGAFVDIGVHQDGLVHVSRLADRFVKDPRDVVKAGDIVKVKVIEVDLARRRIALTMRLGEARAARAAQPRVARPQPSAGAPAKPRSQPSKRGTPAPDAQPRPPAVETAMSAAFSRLLKRT
ncbi:MAG: S1 RNA-binding domain-containing protein, partial [Acidobacteria bacterium]|nr:S1 RNA-binding domain-containing protein [Acidobacteriota bacterium]